jgi:rhamnose transport system permease protein
MRRLPRALRTYEAAIVLLLAIDVIINWRLSPYFLDAKNFSVLSSQYLEVGLMALPMTLLIVVGEIDLSVASMLGAVAAVFGELVANGVALGLAIPIALAFGALLGTVNGVLVTRFGLSSLVVTLGTLALYRGIAEVVLGDQTLFGFPAGFVGLDTRYIGSTLLTYPQLGFAVLAVGFGLVLARSSIGRMLYFTGSNPRAALFAGIRVARFKLALFALSGLLSAVAALTLASRFQSVRNDTGLGLELPVITAVLLGGTDITGGRGTILGTVAAALLVATIRNGMTLANLPDEAGVATVGGLLVVSLLVSASARRTAVYLARRAVLRPRTGGGPLAS